MSKNLHYNYFLPIFLWKFDTPKKTYYHFTDKKGNFWDDWNLEKKEEEKMKQYWKLYKKFYTISFDYYGLYGRGTAILRLNRNENFPYETTDILPVTKRSIKPVYLSFKVFIYPFPDTTLLYISIKENNIYKTIFWDEETKQDKELSRRFNFLPTKENKNVAWYKKFNPFLTKFFYVYENEPTYRYWKPNGESICLPSHDSSGFKTLMDCTNSIVDNIKNKRVFVQTDSEPIYTISIKFSAAFVHPKRALRLYL